MWHTRVPVRPDKSHDCYINYVPNWKRVSNVASEKVQILYATIAVIFIVDIQLYADDWVQ